MKLLTKSQYKELKDLLNWQTAEIKRLNGEREYFALSQRLKELRLFKSRVPGGELKAYLDKRYENLKKRWKEEQGKRNG